MKFFKSKTNILFLFIIFLLVACLSGVSYFAYDKYNDYVDVSNELDENISDLEAAQEKISLSKMTFSHQMIRLIFVEQLYRAFTILNNNPYHHE